MDGEYMQYFLRNTNRENLLGDLIIDVKSMLSNLKEMV